jgi:hypothetical protein
MGWGGLLGIMIHPNAIVTTIVILAIFAILFGPYSFWVFWKDFQALMASDSAAKEILGFAKNRLSLSQVSQYVFCLATQLVLLSVL